MITVTIASPPDFTPEYLALISRQYLAGDAPSELARRFGCERAVIEAALDATTTPRRKRGGTHGYTSRAEARAFIATRNARILELDAEGRSVTEIMAAVGLQRAAVCKVLRQAHGQRHQSSDAQIIALRRSGLTIAAVVVEAHASHRRVTRVLAAAGMTVTAPDLAARTAEIIQRRRAGEHPKAIAAALDIAESTVYRALNGVADLPTLYQGARSRAKTAKAPKPPKPAPIVATPRPPAARPARPAAYPDAHPGRRADHAHAPDVPAVQHADPHEQLDRPPGGYPRPRAPPAD